MRYLGKLKSFYNQYVGSEDRIIFQLISMTLILGLVFIIINKLITHYTGNFYMFTPFFYLLAPMAATYCLGAYAVKKEISPRLGYFVKSFALYFLITFTGGVLVTGIQYAPFQLIDPSLVQLDRVLGFHSIAVLNWTYAHPILLKVFRFTYESMLIQLFTLPFLIAALNDREETSTFYIAFAMASVIGSCIYYFFPTAGPTAMFHDPHFQAGQHATFVKFYEVHHHLKLTEFASGGMIAFPSFHVIWAVLLTYCLRKRKYLYYPMIAFNTIVIASTLFLGWHYFTDVVAGITLASLCIVLAQKIYDHVAHTKKPLVQMQCSTNHRRSMPS